MLDCWIWQLEHPHATSTLVQSSRSVRINAKRRALLDMFRIHLGQTALQWVLKLGYDPKRVHWLCKSVCRLLWLWSFHNKDNSSGTREMLEGFSCRKSHSHETRLPILPLEDLQSMGREFLEGIEAGVWPTCRWQRSHSLPRSLSCLIW